MTDAADRPADRLALLDWDNSLHPGFTMGPWLHALARDEQEGEVARRFDEALASHETGALPYDAFAARAEALYTGLMEGRAVSEVRALAHRFVEHDAVRPGTRELMAVLRDRGIRPVLISGAPIEVLAVHAAALGFAAQDVTGWELERSDGVFRGRLASGNTARGGAKLALVEGLTAAGGRIVLGLGDSPADRPLVDAARIGAWVDPTAPTEATRVRWRDRRTDVERTGSLADLAGAVRAA